METQEEEGEYERAGMMRHAPRHGSGAERCCHREGEAHESPQERRANKRNRYQL